jgi:hypothetical protein
MIPSNLAIVFSPNILRTKGEQMSVSCIADMAYANKLTELFITHFDEVFKVGSSFIVCFSSKTNSTEHFKHRTNLIQPLNLLLLMTNQKHP